MAFNSRPKTTDITNKQPDRAYRLVNESEVNRRLERGFKPIDPKVDKERALSGGREDGSRYLSGGQVLMYRPIKQQEEVRKEHVDYVKRLSATKKKADMEQHGLVDMHEVQAEAAHRASGRVSVAVPELPEDFDWNQGKESEAKRAKKVRSAA